jgi:hypothetical protein
VSLRCTYRSAPAELAGPHAPELLQNAASGGVRERGAVTVPPSIWVPPKLRTNPTPGMASRRRWFSDGSGPMTGIRRPEARNEEGSCNSPRRFGDCCLRTPCAASQSTAAAYQSGVWPASASHQHGTAVGRTATRSFIGRHDNWPALPHCTSFRGNVGNLIMTRWQVFFGSSIVRP